MMFSIVLTLALVMALFAGPIFRFAQRTQCQRNVMTYICLAYAMAWNIVVFLAPGLWPVALLGFLQNVSFTFVSRGRNSGSLTYHLVAAIFSNGLYAALLFTSIEQVSQAKTMPWTFLAVYTLSTLSGSIFAHWLALRIEKGKGRSVQEDKFSKLATQVAAFEGIQDSVEGEVASMRSELTALHNGVNANKADARLDVIEARLGIANNTSAPAAVAPNSVVVNNNTTVGENGQRIRA